MKFRIYCLMIALFGGILSSVAENYFKVGTEWLVRYHLDPPDSRIIDSRFILGNPTEVFGKECMPLFEYWNTDDNLKEVLRTHVRVEGDKVWFLSNTESEEWFLMYDFGLEPGEGCYVWSVPGFYNQTSSARCVKSYVVCKDKEEQSGHTILNLKEYSDETCSYEIGSECGRWYYGIGTLRGVAGNNCFNYDGAGGLLLRVTDRDGNVVYESDKYAEIKSVSSASDDNSDKAYDLYGRRILTPEPGQLIIKSGKKQIYNY